MGLNDIEYSELPKKILVKGHDIVGRCFLNSVDSADTGSAKYDIRIKKRNSKGKPSWYVLNGDFTIKDCFKIITLNLEGNTRNAEGREDLENSLLKLQKLKFLCEKQIECIEKIKELDVER